MIKIGTLNTTNKEVFYLSTQQDNWEKLLPEQNWLVFPIVDRKDDTLLQNVIHACLERNVRYVCTVGLECEYAHDSFDTLIVARKIDLGQPVETMDDFEDSPMTTWHNDFEEGFWFAAIPANDGANEINKVVCLDLTADNNQNIISELLAKTNMGWVPGD